jgi:hypothetical protein
LDILADAAKIGSNTASAIAAGNYASNLSTNTGEQSSISTSVAGTPSSSQVGSAGQIISKNSASAAAFGAITKSFIPLKATVSQNLAAIAAKNAEDRAVNQLLASTVTALGSGKNSAIGAATSGFNKSINWNNTNIS